MSDEEGEEEEEKEKGQEEEEELEATWKLCCTPSTQLPPTLQLINISQPKLAQSQNEETRRSSVGHPYVHHENKFSPGIIDPRILT